LYKYQDFPPEVMLSKLFKPGYACTTHCIQGSTIECDYGLHQLNIPITKFNHVYTMMSRCKSIKQIHAFINSIDETRVYPMERAVNQLCVLQDFSKQTRKGFTYEIRNQDGLVIYIGITEMPDPTARWKQHIDKSSRNRDLTRIDQYLVEGNNSRLCTFHVTGEYNLIHRTELELLETCLITRHINDNPLHMLYNVDKVISRFGKKRKSEEIAEEEVESDGESACSQGSLSYSDVSDMEEEEAAEVEDKPIVKRTRTSMFNGKYGLPRYTDLKLIPDDVYSFVIKIVHAVDKRSGNPTVTHKILAKRMNELLPNGHVKEYTKTFYPVKGPESFEKAFEFMKSTYTHFELFGDHW
jgi:hypothetical protein